MSSWNDEHHSTQDEGFMIRTSGTRGCKSSHMDLVFPVVMPVVKTTTT